MVTKKQRPQGIREKAWETKSFVTVLRTSTRRGAENALNMFQESPSSSKDIARDRKSYEIDLNARIPAGSPR